MIVYYQQGLVLGTLKKSLLNKIESYFKEQKEY